MNETRIDHEVASGFIDGRRWAVVERGFDIPDRLANQLSELTTHWYCGYVEFLPNDYYFDNSEDAEMDLPAPGGITYTGTDPVINQGRKSIGFDTAHPFMDYTQQQVVNETIELTKLLNDLDGKRYDCEGD